MAHRADLIRAGKRVGPIKIYETTLRETKRWFGEPTSRKVVERACVRNVVVLRWGRDLKVYAGRYEGKTAPIAEVHVWDTLHSSVHGDLTIHSRRYIRVGDSEKKVKRKYPGVRAETHEGHTHYMLEEPYDKVMAKVVDGTVVALEARPFEWC